MTPERARRIARKICKAILADVTDRRGFRQEYDQMDAAVKREISNTWAKLIVRIMQESTP